MWNSETITKVAILLLEQGQPDAAFEVLTSVQDWVTDGQLTLRVAFVDNDLLRELGSLLTKATVAPRGRPLGVPGKYTILDVTSPEDNRIKVRFQTTLEDSSVAQDEVMEDLIGIDGLGGLLRQIATDPQNNTKLSEMLYGGYIDSQEFPPKPIRVTESHTE
jgi:hypothetical protein